MHNIGEAFELRALSACLELFRHNAGIDCFIVDTQILSSQRLLKLASILLNQPRSSEMVSWELWHLNHGELHYGFPVTN